MSARATPATQAASRAGIRFTLHEYRHGAAAESYGLEAAEALGVSAERLFKTLVAHVDEARLVVAVIPAARHLNMKLLAAAADGKRAAMAEPTRAQRATGYVLGGISPLGQRSRLPTVLDASALAFETIYVSAGRRGLQIELAPQDLVRATGASTADIAD